MAEPGLSMPQCISCVYYRGADDPGPSCDVFPKGIPHPIWSGEFIHTESYLDIENDHFDGGITYKRSKEAQRVLGKV